MIRPRAASALPQQQADAKVVLHHDIVLVQARDIIQQQSDDVSACFLLLQLNVGAAPHYGAAPISTDYERRRHRVAAVAKAISDGWALTRRDNYFAHAAMHDGAGSRSGVEQRLAGDRMVQVE